MKKKFFIISLVLISGFWLLPLSSLALTVGPVKLEYSIDPGDSISGQILLLNDREETKTFYAVFEKYIEVDDQKQFIAGESEIASWFEFPSAVTLGPREQKMIPFTIKVPEDAEPGGHFAVIWWSTAPPVAEPGAPGVAIVTRAGILVYLRISGEIDESGQLKSFSTSNQKRFLNYLPINFSIVFEATGNVHLKPIGEIKIKNIFGRTREILKVNEFGLSVLPQSKKTYEATWGPKELVGQKKSGFFSQLKNEWKGFAFGFYKAELQLEYGEDKKQAEDGFIFFVIPWRILLIAILVLAVLSFGIVKGIKRYNQWIIAKARK